ncbi:hypothetical protein [Abyssisolibacter fermentans]|uniref:hypothetical protein n=1 Tax=Abyssisolibacter fermentans TaxID=1766203 RepID=UPI0008336C58|nr:hypothetical protein [Abyssisolibacter fermentans]
MLDIIMKIIDKALLPILIPVIIFQYYKYPIKRKNKYIQLTSVKNEILKFILGVTIIYPLISIPMQFVLYKIFGFSISSIINISISICIYFFIGYLYVKSSLKYDKERNVNFGPEFNRKINYIYRNYIKPILATVSMLLISFCTTLTALGVVENINKYKSIRDSMAYIGVTLEFFIINIFFVYYLYSTDKIGLQEYAKDINIFYLQNGNQKVVLGVKYNDFDINKDFVIVYSSNRKKSIVFPRKDLLRIEYFY